MLEPLDKFRQNTLDFPALKEGFQCTTPGSGLRDLLAEELLHHLQNGLITDEQLDACGGIPGFTSTLANVLMELPRNPSEFPKIPVEGVTTRLDWVKLMVGEAPLQHWVHLPGGKSNKEYRARHRHE